MYVGVILASETEYDPKKSIPHVCGGDPPPASFSALSNKYSPCMWGWSFFFAFLDVFIKVFPMYVGVILRKGEHVHLRDSIPHVCGGDPCSGRFCDWSSWVFPMYVGVILAPGGTG